MEIKKREIKNSPAKKSGIKKRTDEKKLLGKKLVEQKPAISTEHPITSSLEASVLYADMLRWQTASIVLLAILLFTFAGLHAGISSILGGASVIISAYIASKIANRASVEATAVLVNMLKAEAIKILLIALILFLVFKNYTHLVPIALIAGLATAALFSGAAMAKEKKHI